ncbi:MAG: hypothetical protein WAM68_01770 [Acidobacteriaceae bacterium]|jgi:hypothetical protein
MHQKPEEVLSNFMKGQLEEHSTLHPGVALPKKERVAEWTLFQILQELRFLNKNVSRLVQIANVLEHGGAK